MKIHAFYEWDNEYGTEECIVCGKSIRTKKSGYSLLARLETKKVNCKNCLKKLIKNGDKRAYLQQGAFSC